MTAIKFKCNGCGDEIIGEVFDHYDNDHRCQQCHIKFEIEEKTRKIDEKQKWLENTHLLEISKLREEVSLLKKKDYMIKDHNPELSAKCMSIIECDTARIAKPGFDEKMFLIIGFNRNTKDDPGQWCRDSFSKIPVPDWDYVQEKVVASGKTESELIESAKEYQRLCGITMEEYLTELAAS